LRYDSFYNRKGFDRQPPNGMLAASKRGRFSYTLLLTHFYDIPSPADIIRHDFDFSTGRSFIVCSSIHVFGSCENGSLDFCGARTPSTMKVFTLRRYSAARDSNRSNEPRVGGLPTT
jgi:hypothetical protein